MFDRSIFRQIGVVLLVTLLLGGSSLANEKVEVVAHRGASFDAPENTLAAFRLAWKQGADAIEGDFFLTRDRKIICTHDATTEKVNKGKRKLVVAKSTLTELRQLDVGSWKGDEWVGERMPTLAQVLETVPEGRRIFIEVKCGEEIIPFLKKEVSDSKLEAKQITIISFRKAVVLKAKISMPEIQTFWLTSFKRDPETNTVVPSLEVVKEVLQTVRADGLSCGDHESITRDRLEKIKAAGYETHVWTVDDPERAKELIAMGMQSITTNRPTLMKAALGVAENCLGGTL